MYADAPLSVTVYPKLLQAINTKERAGWIFNQTGGDQAFFRSASQKSYLTVAPATTAANEAASTTWIWAVVAIVAGDGGHRRARAGAAQPPRGRGGVTARLYGTSDYLIRILK